MWRLCIEDDEANRTVVNLVRKEYTIGRAEENAVRLTERNVSRKHAMLRRTNEGWVLEDLESDTGSFVNERRVSEPVPMEHRDKVRIGDYDITLLDSEKEAEEAAIDKQTETVPASVESDRSVERHDRLVVVEGPNPGTQYPLLDKKILIGRGEECDLTLPDTSVSRVHASLMRDEHGRFHVSDQKSSNGVRVNGMEITKIPLYAGDIVELGDVHLQFVPKGSRFDESALRPATGARSVPAKAASGGKWWVGLGLLGIVGGIVWFSSQKRQANEAQLAATLPTSNIAESLLNQAESMLNASDTEAALTLLRSVPAESALKGGTRYRSLVNAWVDQHNQKIEVTPDATEKARLLGQLIAFEGAGETHIVRAREQLRALTAVTVDAGGDTEPDPSASPSMSVVLPGSLPPVATTFNRPAAAPKPPTPKAPVRPPAPPAPATKPPATPSPGPAPGAAPPPGATQLPPPQTAPAITPTPTPISPPAAAPTTAPKPAPSPGPAPAPSPAPMAPSPAPAAPPPAPPVNSPPVVNWPGATP